MRNVLIGLLVLVFAVPAFGADAVSKRKMTFRQALLKAAEAENKAGDLSDQELRRLRMVTLIPGVAKRVQTYCAEEIIARGLKPACADPYTDSLEWDWEALIEAIRQILQMVLEFISMLIPLFSQVAPGVAPVVGWCAPLCCAA